MKFKMDSYLLILGLWNIIGCLVMFAFIKDSNANKLLVEWSQIFTEKYSTGYYGKLWLIWAIGVNIFFALINIMCIYWNILEIKEFVIWADIIIYILFILLSIIGLKSGKLGKGIYIGFLIFITWILWGFSVI